MCSLANVRNMDLSYIEYPFSMDLNILKAYVDLKKCKLPKINNFNNPSNYKDFNSATIIMRTPKTLRHIILDFIIDNWSETPIYENVTCQADRNYILSNLNVNLPLKILSLHIRDDMFWRKCYQQRWKTLYYKEYKYQYQHQYQHQHQQQKQQQHQHQHHERESNKCNNKIEMERLKMINPLTTTTIATTVKALTIPATKKPWINIYMEKHLQEFIENLTTAEYEQESIRLQETLDICAMYINQLEINYLQPNMDDVDGQHDHIPLDFILSNLPELHTLRLTYCTKTIGMNYYLGCNTLTQRDATLLARGLSRCHELKNFCLHNVKLEAYQLRLFAASLDKGCHYLTTLALQHCGFGDEGIRQFLDVCHHESFLTLKYLDLTNNKLSCEGAFALSRVIKNLPLETLILHLNPIGGDGAAIILPVLAFLPIQFLDIGSCCLTDTITKLFMKLIIQCKTLRQIDISNNCLGKNFHKHLLKVIGFNPNLEHIDLRNTHLTSDMKINNI